MARPRQQLKGGEVIAEPNMTPLIDVSLVLVVILMVATPLAFQSSIAVNTANKAGKAAQEARTERIEVTVHADGTIGVNRMIVPRQALSVTLKPLIENSATRMVVVRCDDGVLHGEFVSVLDEAKAMGAARIAVVGT